MTVINITDGQNKIMSHQNRNIESLQYFYRGLDWLNNHINHDNELTTFILWWRTLSYWHAYEQNLQVYRVRLYTIDTTLRSGVGMMRGTASEVRDVNVFLKARMLGLTLIISWSNKFDYQRFIYLRFLVQAVRTCSTVLFKNIRIRMSKRTVFIQRLVM